MSNFVLYSGLNFDIPSYTLRSNKWRKSASYFTNWLSNTVDGWLDRSMPEAASAFDLDQAHRDLKIG